MPRLLYGSGIPPRSVAGVARLGGFRREPRLALWLVAIFLAALASATGAAHRPWLECGTTGVGSAVAPRRVSNPPPGTLLLAVQEPAAVHYAYEGVVRFTDLAVLGDFESVDFQIDSFSGSRTFSAERHARRVNAQGEVVSHFAIAGTLAEWVVLPFNWNVDIASPILFSDLLYLGPTGNQRPIFLPIMVLPKKLPGSKVIRAGKRFQYASNVVNIAVPGLHQRQLDEPGHLGFDPEALVEMVEEELGRQIYDEYGFGLWQHQLTNPGAFHQNRMPGTWSYSLYSSVVIPAFGLWKHEIGHNWNFRFDLPRLVGWNAPFDGAHSRGPLAEDPGLLCGSAYPVQKVDGKWRTVWIRDPHPFHPLELFAMGLLDPGEVPQTIVFKRQTQRDFLPDLPIRGPRRTLDVDDVIEEYGMPGVGRKDIWRVAPVIVSEELLPRKVLSRLNFYMRRIEDPEGAAPGSFDRSTGGRMDLTTTLETGSRRSARPPRKVTFPPIGIDEIPGLALRTAVPTCLELGNSLIIEGTTATGELPDLVMVSSNPASPEIDGRVTTPSGGGFRATFAPDADGDYRIEVGAIGERQPVRFGPIYVTERCTRK